MSETGFSDAYLAIGIYNEKNLATCQVLRTLRNVFLNYVFKSVKKVRQLSYF